MVPSSWKKALAAGLGAACLLLAAAPPLPAQAGEIKLAPETLPGLVSPARVRRDAYDIPHIFALNNHDALFMLGYVHAHDRFFQMDLLRRTFSGTLAELVGGDALEQDVELRTLGLRRAAAETWDALPALSKEWLTAYAQGVNAFLGQAGEPVAPEYAALELSRAGIPPWTEVDSVVIAKGLAFGLSFDLGDIDLTLALTAFQTVGLLAGFDGAALFSEDLYRSAPFDPSVSIPGFLAAPATAAEAAPVPAGLPPYLSERAVELLEGYREKAATTPMLRRALERRDAPVGSNWWIAAGSLTESGYPILANDPHLALDAPSVFYEAQFRVPRGPDPALNVIGVSFPGTPAVVQGCNGWACWGSTVNPMDVTDVYLEQLVFDPVSGLPTHTVFRGELEPLVVIPQVYRLNQVGDGTPDNLATADVGPTEGGLTLIVPRRNNGPIVSLDLSDPLAPLGLSIQYTGWGATFEIEALRRFARSRELATFRESLQFFDVGSQNWSYADVQGNIAYFTSAELPLREDLQTLMAPDGGVPPFLLRDGTGTLRHEWLPAAEPGAQQALPYEILPFDEMPQVVNPARGYILNANNDPVGTTVDNNPLNQVRPGGGLYYLSPGYSTGFRMGRIQRLFDAAVAGGGGLTMADIQAIQANNQLLDAEVFVPYITAAFANAQAPGADAALAAFAADPGVAEAVGRLAAWDFSTPTGIPEGYDPGDDPADLPAPDQAEIDASVAATLYAVWRGQAVANVIDATLERYGLEDFAPGSDLALSALRNLLDSFPANQGVGASGVPFFVVPGVADPAAARDIVLLASLRDALDLLAGDAFAPAFGNSTEQSDYRWGYLHRIVFDHPLGGPFSTPPAGGPADLGPELPGIPRSGGLGAVDASSHSARADSANDFMFGHGPARRFVGHMLPSGPDAMQTIPGGESGVLGSPHQSDLLMLWLTNQYHALPYRPGDVVQASRTFQVFLPAE